VVDGEYGPAAVRAVGGREAGELGRSGRGAAFFCAAGRSAGRGGRAGTSG
jgi:hypothetical protein